MVHYNSHDKLYISHFKKAPQDTSTEDKITDHHNIHGEYTDHWATIRER